MQSSLKPSSMADLPMPSSVLIAEDNWKAKLRGQSPEAKLRAGCREQPPWLSSKMSSSLKPSSVAGLLRSSYMLITEDNLHDWAPKYQAPRSRSMADLPRPSSVAD